MELKTAMEVLEGARKEQSCELADGLIDNLVPYWETIEEAFGNILSDGRCLEALATVAGDSAAIEELDSGHMGFFKALVSRHDQAAEPKGNQSPKPGITRPDTLASDYPDIAEFIERGLYEAFSVPDAFGTFDLAVFPRACEVTGEYLPVEGCAVSGYTIGNGKMLLVTRDGDKVVDIRHAEATTNNIHLIMRQGKDRPFDWDAIESPAHDMLERGGAIPPRA